jgi:Domain of unknown function (DUF4760)
VFAVPSQNAIAIAQTYGLWIQTGAICISAVAALCLVIWTQRVASRRATLDLIMMEQSDPRYIRERRHFIRLRDQGNLVQWAPPANSDSVETAAIRAALNGYELVAIGIFQSTLNTKIYRQYCRTTLVKDWIACKPFIVQIRHATGNEKYFCEYEKLAKKWATKAERLHV